MKTRSSSIAAGLLLLIALVLAWFQWSSRDHASDDSVEPHAARKALSPGIPAPPSTTTRAGHNNPNTESTSVTDKEGILNEIQEASVTYDPGQLPRIAAFLNHTDAQIRQAAIDGMIVLGDSAAAPLLREAAKNALTAKEAVELEEAAAYMELPSARNVLRNKKKNTPARAPQLAPP